MWYGVNDQLAIYGLTYNFLPSWWRQNYGLTFGERIVFDPDYRLKSYRFMERTVHERFPVLHIGSPNPPTRGILPDFGNTITAAAAGLTSSLKMRCCLSSSLFSTGKSSGLA